MLPSMPILFSRESQDAFGNKIESSKTLLTTNTIANTDKKQETQSLNHEGQKSEPASKELKLNGDNNRKEEPNKSKIDENALETALVRSYFTKVKSRFPSNLSLPTNKFAQFRDLLKSFDPGKETPVDLYRKVDLLFGEEHKDIVEEFLLFLKPGQAAEVGRFMDHFMLTQMTSFIKLLQTTFARKPAVYRKILRAITTSINNGSSQDLKTRVLPHLRTNPKLSQMFKSMFPDERPPDSAYDAGTDVINENFLECDEGYDVWEFEAENKKRKIDVKEGFDSVYLHGRVFLQHGRLLRSASVTYPYSKEPYRVHARRLAPNTCLSPPDSDEERSTKRNGKTNCKVPPKRSRKQTKSPTKTVKDVNDNTKKDLKQALSKVKGKVAAKTRCKNEENIKKNKLDVKEVNVCGKKEDLPKAKPKDAKKARNWTREEDKTMLEVLKGEGGSDKVLVRICKLLPHRSQSEVKERFCHVMNLLQQMAVNEVT
ncbi:unnamed protein product [Colias eurytheme]|nr:unnamed protein product [Colias eurytheme]